jgi:hypothetical protein
VAFSTLDMSEVWSADHDFGDHGFTFMGDHEYPEDEFVHHAGIAPI